MEERLKKFACLVDCQSFTAAAQKLHTSQPALTTAVQKLERELKTTLLVRSSRGITLTEAGIVAYKHGQTLMTHEKNLWHDLRNLQNKKQPLSLGCIDSVAELVVEDGLMEILEADCSLSLTVQNSQQLLDALKRGELDVAIVAARPDVPVMVAHRPLGDEKFSLVCSPTIEEASIEHIRAGKLTDFLAYNLGSTTNKLISKQLEDNGVRLQPRFYSTNPSVLLSLAIQGKGVAALPSRLVVGHKLSELPLKKPIKRPLVAAWQQGRKLPTSVQNFLDAAHVQLSES